MSKAVKLCKRDETLIANLQFNRNSTSKTKITNPFSGGSEDLDARGVALYDYILGAEAMSLYKEMQTGLTLFRRLYADEYYTLLD
jgi:hypothetical protein